MADEPDLKYPLAPTDEWYGEANYKTTGGNLVEMTPEDFLSRVRPLDMDEISRENIGFLKEHIVSGRLLDPLQIYRNGSEDGRHRAHAAKELGIKKIPVITWTDPRSVDRSKLPAVIDAASAATGIARLGANEPRPKGKGEVFRGIGSLARRRVFPLVRLAQEGYGMLSDEQKDELQEFLARPAHELVGMEKPGIEYVRDWLGMEQPSPTESPDRKSQASKTTQEKLDDFFLNMGEDGVGTEYPDVYRGIERYVMNADRKGLSDALSSESYPEYRRVMQFNLRSMFPDGSIPVKRVEGYGQGPGVDRKTKRFNVSPEDVVFVGGESEYELIIKGAKYGYDRPVSVRITPKAPERKASGGFVDKPLYNDARIGGMI